MKCRTPNTTQYSCRFNRGFSKSVSNYDSWPHISSTPVYGYSPPDPGCGRLLFLKCTPPVHIRDLYEALSASTPAFGPSDSACTEKEVKLALYYIILESLRNGAKSNSTLAMTSLSLNATLSGGRQPSCGLPVDYISSLSSKSGTRTWDTPAGVYHFIIVLETSV